MLYSGYGQMSAEWKRIITSLDLLLMQDTRLPHARLAVHHDPQGLLSRAVPQPGQPQAVLVQGVTPATKQSQEAPTLEQLFKW